MTEINEQLLGQYKDDKMHGKGTLYLVEGNKYTGDMMNDKFEGQGVYIWANGNRYEMKCSEMSCYHLM